MNIVQKPELCGDEDEEDTIRPTVTWLGGCERFALHGHAGVTAANPSDVTEIHGDVGAGTGADSITGFGNAPLPHVYDADGYDYYGSASVESIQCALDKEIVYGALRLATCTDTETGPDLGGLTLSPGVYCNTEGYFELKSDLILDGGGREDAVFIFQAASTVITSINTDIVLINGAQAKNVFWAAGSAITLHSYSTFRGTMIAYSAITLGVGTVLDGRALASVESVTLAGADLVSLPGLTVNW